MRIVVDMREVEAALARGEAPAGVLENACALADACEGDEVVFVGCASREDSMLAIRGALAALVPRSAVRGYEVPQACSTGDEEALRQALIASLAPDAVRVADTGGGEASSAPEAAVPPIAAREARPRLYYVSPFPPQRTGIAAYSAQFLPFLARHYDIELVVADDAPLECRDGIHTVRTASWLATHARPGDRVLYHFGNSELHAHMPDLLERVPGCVVLHDFFLGHLVAHRENVPPYAPTWTRELCHAHGYEAVRARFADPAAAVWAYPVSLSVIERALGVTVHSASSARLAAHWYGDDIARKFRVVAMPRALAPPRDRAATRRELGLEPDAFVVCAFGMLGPSKHNGSLVEAWAASTLARDPRCRLVFVGESPDPAHAAMLARLIGGQGFARAPKVTGWMSADGFDAWLCAADVAVQLRTASRGETSAAALDCMARGLPTVVNANGSFADLAPDAVVMLPDEFTVEALAGALDDLHGDPRLRDRLSTRARSEIADRHDPGRCAQAFRDVIEASIARAAAGYEGAVARAAVTAAGDAAIAQDWAGALAATFAHARPSRLFVDVSITCREDLRTGIQRAVRALALALVRDDGLAARRVEPVYASDAGGRWHFRYARGWTAQMLGVPRAALRDEAVEFQPGDTLLSLDLGESLVHEVARGGVYRALRARGVAIGFVVYDTLPLVMPGMFPPGRTEFARWLAAVGEAADFVACISRDVARDVAARFAAEGHAARVGWFHLGADVESSAPTRGLPAGAQAMLERIASRSTFLMVGTIEPRKGHLQAIEAFTRLWERGVDADLVIVGAEGWRQVPEPMRRTIPAIVARIGGHPERGKRLSWIDDASDEFLAQLFAGASCLLAASEGEGFGLPLVEAARHGLPIVARDIPVFREVAGDHALYFAGRDADDLAGVLVEWLAMREAGTHPRPEGIAFRTWEQSARDLLHCVDELVP